MLPICFPYAAPYVQKCSFSVREWPHLPICVSHMLKLGPYVDLFFAICYHMLDNIWATYNLVVFENNQHMGHIWAAYGPHMGCPYVAHMWPICFGRSSADRCTQVRYASVINTGNATDDCFSSLSPRCSLTVLQLYIHVHDNSEVQNGCDLGSRKQAAQNSLVCRWWMIETSYDQTLASLCFFSFIWTIDHCTWLVPIETTIDSPSALDLTNGRRSIKFSF